MRDMMHELGIEFVEDVGEAAFYGPKIDINAKNVYGKRRHYGNDPVGCTLSRAV